MPIIDQNTKNPSRSIRLAGAIRDNGNIQKLLDFRGPVSLKELRGWLMRWPDLMPKPRVQSPPIDGDPRLARLPGWIKKVLIEGVDPSKGRNKTYFGIGSDFAKCGFTLEDTLDILESNYFTPERDFTLREFRTAIKSGFKNAEEGK